MIKKILVALDPDSDTPVATRCAIEIARRHAAEVVGLALIDSEGIEKGSRGGAIGSMHYAEKIREALTDETREAARSLVEAFTETMTGSGLGHRVLVQEGGPHERIADDMKYHDLLVVGRNPHFFYGRPNRETDILVQVVHESVGPKLIVSTTDVQVRKVLVAFDGSSPAARAMKQFAQTAPFGTDVQVEVLNVYDEDSARSELILRLASEYLQSFGFLVTTSSQHGSHAEHAIVEHASDTGADLVVLGADSAKKIRRLAFGSTTVKFLRDSKTPLYLDH
ncbi:MAG TPA: universal stress protein [Rhodothermales bacterium]